MSIKAPYVVQHIRCRKSARRVRRAGGGNVPTGLGLRPVAKAPDEPPNPTGYAPPLDSTCPYDPRRPVVEVEVRFSENRADGTITNDGAMPIGLLARFGRATATHVVDQVEARIEAPRDRGFEGRFAGRDLNADAAVNLLTDLQSSPGVKPGSPRDDTATLKLRVAKLRACAGTDDGDHVARRKFTRKRSLIGIQSAKDAADLIL